VLLKVILIEQFEQAALLIFLRVADLPGANSQPMRLTFLSEQ